MDYYTAIFIDNFDKDDSTENLNQLNQLKSGKIEFYSDKDDTFIAKIELDLNMITMVGDYDKNNILSDDIKRDIFKNFIGSIYLNNDYKINFKHEGGEIAVVKKGDIFSFITTGENYGCTFNVKLNMSLMNAFNKIAH